MVRQTLEQPLWKPMPGRAARTQMAQFTRWAEARWQRELPDYAALHAWSIADPEAFWLSLWDFMQVRGEPGERVVVDGGQMPGARWFPNARLNFTQNLLRRQDGAEALVFWGEDRVRRRLTYGQLYREVARCAAAFRAMGVVPGDRIAAYMPNMPETVIVMLAAASVGAIFTSASPDFGVQGACDRFGQVAPKVLVGTDAYTYNGKHIDTMDRLREVSRRLASLERVVVVPYIQSRPDLSGIAHACTYSELVLPYFESESIAFAQLPFEHPLYILYSSGTTGTPKCIVHGAGGVLLQHLKEHRLHCDLHAGDRLFYFTTCGWMMWNWLVSGLATEATLMLYDGSPLVAQGKLLFDYAELERCTHFGTSARFIDAIAKAGLRPRRTHVLNELRMILSTGSPLLPESFDYVYRDIKKDVCLASISGGTDIVSCFVLGNPALPVWRGEIQCKGLGQAVAVFDEQGRAVRGIRGELVCTRPFPAMPLGFWNDPDGARYHAAYFERFEGVWHHGDFCEETEHGGFIIYGRSDATLNPGGVRIGTAEIYRQVEQFDEVLESVVIGQDWPPQQPRDVRVVLFVRLREGCRLEEELISRIKEAIRANTSPRHVPAKILQVPDIPRTRSGKIVELAVRNVVHGRPAGNLEALANAAALEYFKNRDELKY